MVIPLQRIFLLSFFVLTLFPIVTAETCEKLNLSVHLGSYETVCGEKSNYQFPKFGLDDILVLESLEISGNGICTLPNSSLYIEFISGDETFNKDEGMLSYGGWYILLPEETYYSLELNCDSNKFNSYPTSEKELSVYELSREINHKGNWVVSLVTLNPKDENAMNTSISYPKLNEGYRYHFRVYDRIDLENQRSGQISFWIAVVALIVTSIALCIDIDLKREKLQSIWKERCKKTINTIKDITRRK